MLEETGFTWEELKKLVREWNNYLQEEAEDDGDYSEDNNLKNGYLDNPYNFSSPRTCYSLASKNYLYGK